MQRIESEAIRMTGLVESLLTLTRMDEIGNLKLREQDLSEIASAVVKDASVANPKVRFLTQSSTSAKANVDGDRIKQVLTNLVNNAGRFSPDDSEVQVAVSSANGKHRLEVIDHGEGIPEMLRDKVFDRFYRADSSRNRETGGSGLGLGDCQVNRQRSRGPNLDRRDRRRRRNIRNRVTHKGPRGRVIHSFNQDGHRERVIQAGFSHASIHSR